MIDELLKYDTEVFLFLNNLGSENWDVVWKSITNKWTFTPLYAVLLYLVFKNYGLKGTLIIAVCAALMFTFTDQLSNLFKYTFQRPRPCQVEELKENIRFVAVRCGRFGYFSAHAASSMAAAVFVSLLLKSKYRFLPFLLLLWAAIVAYSRIYLGVHYPLDIISGMIFGGFAGWIFFLLQKWIRLRFNIS